MAGDVTHVINDGNTFQGAGAVVATGPNNTQSLIVAPETGALDPSLSGALLDRFDDRTYYTT